MLNKPQELYHGSNSNIDGLLRPILETSSPDHIHTKPAVFATERMDLAALFMCPTTILHSIGFEQDISYMCVWGTVAEFMKKDSTGFIYVLPPDTFEKVGKGYEWQSFIDVMPISVKIFPKSLLGMIDNGVQVYFINNNSMFDQIVENKNHRALILKKLGSENERLNKNIRKFK